jgi:uncharacterized protein
MLQLYAYITHALEGTYTLRILQNAFDLLLKIGPYLLLSIALSVTVNRIFRKAPLRFSIRNELLSILSAALVGLASPLPTYAAIPLGLSLMSTGLPFSAVIAFAIASPLMNPSIFFLTTTELGIEMALARTVTAFMLGVTSGVLIMTLFKSLSRGGTTVAAPPPPSDRSLTLDLRKTFLYSAKYFSVAILLSSAVKALVPAQAVADLLGADARMGTLTAMALGVPFFSCGGAAIPFMETLQSLGMSKGAVLAFFIAGPATKLETLYAFKTLLGMKILLYYLALTFAFSVIASMLFSLF